MADWAPASVSGTYAGSSAHVDAAYGVPKLLVGELALCGLTFILAVAADCGAADCKVLVANAILAGVFCVVLLVCRLKRIYVGHRNELGVYGVLGALSFVSAVVGATGTGTATHRAAVAFTFFLCIALGLSTAIALRRMQQGAAQQVPQRQQRPMGGPPAAPMPNAYHIDDAAPGGMGGAMGAGDSEEGAMGMEGAYTAL